MKSPLFKRDPLHLTKSLATATTATPRTTYENLGSSLAEVAGPMEESSHTRITYIPAQAELSIFRDIDQALDLRDIQS